MADPLSIVSVVEGSVGLILQCGSVIKTLSEIAAKFKKAELTVRAMIVELDTIEMAWKMIQEWAQRHSEELPIELSDDSNRVFINRLERSMECGTLVMSALQDDLIHFTSGVGILTFRQRSRVTWSEKALRDHQDRIRGQAAAMGLLLQAMKLPTAKRREQLVKAYEPKFSKYDESAYSIVPSRRSSAILSDSSLSIHSLETMTRRLSFDSDLFSARVYKRNYKDLFVRSVLRPKWGDRSQRQGESRNKPLALQRTSHLNQTAKMLDDNNILHTVSPQGEGRLPASTDLNSYHQKTSFEKAQDEMSRALFEAGRTGQTNFTRDPLEDGAPADRMKSAINLLCECVARSGSGGTPTARSRSDMTPLHITAAMGSSSMTQLLLESGFNVSAVSSNGWQPIDVAVAGGFVNVVKVLIRHEAILSCEPGNELPIHRCMAFSDQCEMIELAVRNGFVINSRDEAGRTALHTTCIHRHYDNARTLLNLGADLLPYKPQGESPLGIALMPECEGLLSVVLAHNSNARCSENGMTIPMLALSACYPPHHVLKILHICRCAGTSLMARDYSYNGVLHHLALRHHQAGYCGPDHKRIEEEYEILDYLLGLGADLYATNVDWMSAESLALQKQQIWLHDRLRLRRKDTLFLSKLIEKHRDFN